MSLEQATGNIAQATNEKNVLPAFQDTNEQDMGVINVDVQHNQPKIKMISVGTQLASRPLHYRSKSK